MTESLCHQLNSLERTVDRELSKYPIMLQLERRTGLRKTTFLLLVLLGVLYLFLLRLLPAPTMALTLYVYPTIASVAAAETGETRRTSEETRWLAYWIVLALWELMETFLGVFFLGFPLYRGAKMAAFMYMMAPQTRGANVVFERAVRPVAHYLRNHPIIQDSMRQLKKGSTTGASSKFTASASKVTVNPSETMTMGVENPLKASRDISGKDAAKTD